MSVSVAVVRAPRFKIIPLQIWDLEISNPVGLAAGFDKDGEAIDGHPLPCSTSSEC